MKLKSKIIIISLLLLLVWIFSQSVQTHTYPDKKEIDCRIHYLERMIKQQLNSTSEIALLSKNSYEFILFTYAFTAYGMTNIATKDSLYKEQATAIIKESISKVLDSTIYFPYAINESVKNLDSIPDYSVLYLGHLNLMIGCYRLLSNDNCYNSLNDKISTSLSRRYNASPYYNLESYASSIWLADNAVAIASLKLYSINALNSCDTLCKKWVQFIKSKYIDNGTGVLYSTIHSGTGFPLEEPRGSMLGWTILFMYQFDEEFAIELYNNYKNYFSNNFFLFRLFKERYKNYETSIGDIDSGPIILGFSIPANEFALGASIIAGDYNTAKKVERLIDWGTKKISQHNEIKYETRFLNMPISPMAEALVLNSMTITKWVKK